MKARLTVAITEQVGECEYERHYDWVDVEVLLPKSLNKNYKKCDIIGGQWLKESEGKYNE